MTRRIIQKPNETAQRFGCYLKPATPVAQIRVDGEAINFEGFTTVKAKVGFWPFKTSMSVVAAVLSRAHGEQPADWAQWEAYDLDKLRRARTNFEAATKAGYALRPADRAFGEFAKRALHAHKPECN